MNDAVDSGNLSGLFTSLASSFDPGYSLDRGINPAQPIEFMDILSDQELLSGFLSQLKELLPAEELAPISSMLGSGNGLPLTAEVAGELPSALNPELVQALFARFGLSPGPVGRRGPAEGGPRVMVNAARNSLAGFGQRLGDGNTGPSDGRVATTDSPIRAIGPALDMAPEILPAKSGQDVMPVQLQPPLTELMPKSVPLVLRTRGGLEEPPSLEFNMISGVMGRVAPEAVTAPRVLAQPLLELNAPLGKAGWDQGLGERVLWLVGRSVQGASMRINPPHLGPIDIQLTLQNDQASVSFAAQQGTVREALEAAIPRLREMFGENNLQLVNVDVGERNSGDPRPHAQNADRNPDSENGALAESGEREESPEQGLMDMDSTRYYGSDGLLDDYA